MAYPDETLQHVSILSPGWDFLQGKQRNDTSQFGEDGLIEAVFARIGEQSRWCFEVGAADGLFFSNTKRLRDIGWSAVLIEGDGTLAEQCRKFENDRVTVVQERIGSESLDAILARAGSPREPDLGVIDIDGQDYWAWKFLTARPRVMLVEYGYWNPPERIPEPHEGTDAQAGCGALYSLAEEKGYIPLAKTYCNVLFVDKTCLSN